MVKSIKKNYLYNLIYQLLVIVLPIITTPYLARTLGVNGNGVYGYTISIVTLFILFGSLGIYLYGQREIAYNQDDIKKRSKIFWELISIKVITLSISTIIFCLLFACSGNYVIYYRILIVLILADLFDISWFYQGIEDFKIVLIRNVILRSFTVLLIFIFVKNSNDIWKYIVIYSLSNLLPNILFWINIRKKVCLIPYKKLNIRYHIKPIFLLFIPQISVQLYMVLDKTMIGFITNNMIEVGYFDQAQKIILILLTIITSLGTVMLPRIASCFIKNEKNKISEYMNKTFKFTFMLSFPLILGLISVTNCFVPLFFGQGYDKIKILLPILSVLILFMSLNYIIGTQYLLPIKRQNEYTISIVIGALVNFILNIILIKFYLSIGACICTAISECIVTLVQLYFIRKDFDLKKTFKSSIKYLLCSIIMFIFCYSIYLFKLSNFITLLLQVIIGVTVYALLMILTQDELIMPIVNKYINKLRKRS